MITIIIRFVCIIYAYWNVLYFNFTNFVFVFQGVCGCRHLGPGGSLSDKQYLHLGGATRKVSPKHSHWHLMGQLEKFPKKEQQCMLDLSSDFNRKERIWYYDEPPGPCWWRAPAPWELVLGGELQLCSLRGETQGSDWDPPFSHGGERRLPKEYREYYKVKDEIFFWF